MKKVFTSMSTGLKELDRVFQGVHPGDNIVFQVDSIEDYIPFVHPFCIEATGEKRELIYFRFADHPWLLPENVNAHIYELNPNDGFENFISAIFDVIEKFGKGACYVFDSLSDLVADWYSDRMLGNFFMLTCPYLYDFETATYFALLRGHHMSIAIKAIHNTAQVIVDVYNRKQQLYLHPLKVYKRYSPTMYMLHQWKNQNFVPVSNSAVIAEIMTSLPQPWLDFTMQPLDIWTRAFIKAAGALAKAKESPSCGSEETSLCTQLLRMAVTREPQLLKLAQRYFDLQDLVAIGKRMVGTGLIGGKSVGMLLARAILIKQNPKWTELLEPHDSFFIGSDVFYSYLIQNGCWWLRRKLKKQKTFRDHSEEVRERLLNGSFPEEIVAQFREMLDYFGQSPLIVRSSSLLEDAYGNAFSGKYESVFCANQGTPAERLDSFINAVRQVYASTLTYEALAYRAHRGLLDRDEQMALLVMRVSGARYDTFYFPQLAGVGFSYNPYVWSNDIDPKAGMIRLVFGLGTRAVDRTDDDYTRLIALNEPLKMPAVDTNDVKKYTQKRVDVLDLDANKQRTADFEKVVAHNQDIPLDIFASQDRDLERRAREHGFKNIFPYYLNFEKLLQQTDFINNMTDMLASLQKAYRYPVDIEFTANFIAPELYRINLVQCRPFQVKGEVSAVKAPKDIALDKIVFKTQGPIIGTSLATAIDRIIYIVPQKYSNLKLQECYALARIVGQLTHLEESSEQDKKITALVGPGRWGTTTPALGVPVSFSDINTVSVLCEVAKMHEGLIPDVSLGTHFFNDLVETDILYLAIHPENNESVFNEEFLEKTPSKLKEMLPGAASWASVIRVIEPDGNSQLFLSADAVGQEAVCYLKII
ncbi:MAG: PEP/pyruvate-binding domain-containing protein [Spirochaetales bacterium]|nr:PEP/pyruvate-binding domain-containing protein [Spirochaetales bacterium]